MGTIRLVKLQIFTFVIAFALTGCKTIEPVKPVENYLSTDIFKKEVSIINVPISFDLTQLEERINSELTGLMFEDHSEEKNSSLSLKIWKKAPIQITADGDHFNVMVPLKIWARAGLSFNNFGISFADEKETTFEIDLQFNTKAEVSPDWDLKTVTTSNGFEWVKKPVINLGPVKVPLASFLGDVIESQQEQLAHQIDREALINVDIQSMVREAWMLIQTPYQVSKEYNIWLLVTPIDILMTPLSGSGKHSMFSFGIKAYTETYIGETPAANINRDLPNITFADSISSQFSVGLSSKIPCKEINRLLTQQFVNRSFSFNNGKRQITITDINLYGSGNDLVIQAGIKGSVNGVIYLKGKPAFNPSLQTLYMEDLDFDLQTKNKLIKTASWVMHGKLLESFSEALTLPLGEQIKWATATIEQNLNNLEISPGVYLKGSLDELKPSGVFITRESIIATVTAKGKAGISVSSFDYPAYSQFD